MIPSPIDSNGHTSGFHWLITLKLEIFHMFVINRVSLIFFFEKFDYRLILKTLVFFLEPSIAVTLSPRCVGSLFITDLFVTDCYQERQKQQQQHLSPKVIFLSESPQFASLASQQAIDQITTKQNELKSHKLTESSNCDFNSSDFLLKSSMFLSHAPSVAIVSVGAFEKQLAAVVCLAKALLAQEKEVTILTAENIVSEWKTFISKCEAKDILLKCIPVTSLDAHAVIHSLGSRFHSTSLNSVVIVNEEGECKETLSVPVSCIRYKRKLIVLSLLSHLWKIDCVESGFLFSEVN